MVDTQALQEFHTQVCDNIAQVIVGKEDAVNLVLIALLSDGHILLEDVPGVGKTMLARAAAASLGLRFSRIQCTPDLLPSDVTGLSVFNQKADDFVFRPGPVFSQIVLTDEINRATPRTQSSLLECMAEGQVTVDGQTRVLHRPFLVMATQNPVEYEGTFPLPEAQLDRFFLKLNLGYPTAAEEEQILVRLTKDHPIHQIKSVTNAETVLALQAQVRNVHVKKTLREYIVRLTQATRTHPDVLLGASPRGSISLLRAGQALAGLQGRDYVVPDDVKKVALPILGHRIIVKPESSLRGVTPENTVEAVLRQTPVELEDLPAKS